MYRFMYMLVALKCVGVSVSNAWVYLNGGKGRNYVNPSLYYLNSAKLSTKHANLNRF